MDLEDFFASVGSGRVYGIFRSAGYPQSVSRLLTGLCTSRAPANDLPTLPPYAARAELAALHRSRQRYRTRHLPQGAPTSPALANLAAFGMDVRLLAAAEAVGASYTRYADDLVFSGDRELAHRAPRFQALVAAIALEAAFAVQHRKTRVMTSATRQQITGIVVNARPSIARDSFDRLKAMLHNCVRFGPESQNHDRHASFRSHLEGAVAWVSHVHPARGEKLERVLRTIDWNDEHGPRQPAR